VLVAAALYGFSSYSAGFPILTVAQGTRSGPLGVLAYFVFLAVSAGAGLVAGRWARRAVSRLALAGYLGAAVGSAGLGAAYVWHGGVAGLYASMAVLGFALGVVETLEPTLVARLAPQAQTGGGMGALTAARSVGLFLANLVLGLLYHFGPAWAYGYATVLALAAAGVLMAVGLRARLWAAA
jgi:MFS family permease